MSMPPQEVAMVRDLARQVAEIAALPMQAEKAELWRRLNALDPVRPLVMLQNGAWNETLDDREAQCQDEFCRRHELHLRRTLYQWQHMRGDMVVEDTIHSPVEWCTTPASAWG